MSTRAEVLPGTVLARTPLSDHLVRLELGGEGLGGFASTGVPDEWVALVVPGQFQSRYYTVRSWDGARLLLDVVVHDHGLVTDWAAGDCVGDVVGVGPAKGSFALPDDAGWLVLAGDLTALPAVARIAEHVGGLAASAGRSLPVVAHLEVPGGRPLDYVSVPPGAEVELHWHPTPADGRPSALADVVAGLDWPAGPGYFWMAGESGQMRAIRKHLRIDRGWASTAYDVMGYWRGATATRRGTAPVVDPGPIWRAGKAAGKSDEQIWAEYDAAREEDA